ncbi:YncE family protein [Streptomyces hygroscopicus]|uniref:YncE family protein n=1 Tax=Streptomyces hygroscopicus TaxID=1912 RepID=UPI00223FCDB0|nr:YncE family protein [Streptomyces hygroscopicus]
MPRTTFGLIVTGIEPSIPYEIGGVPTLLAAITAPHPPTRESLHMPRRLSPRALLALAAGVLIALAAAVTGVLLTRGGNQPSKVALPLRPVKEIALPGDSSRFDYASLDASRGLLFIAHLGASQVIEVDVRAGRVVRTIDGLPGVHGVLVVPDRHEVYATATDANQVVAMDEATGTVLHHTPTGDYPDGLAYDPAHGTLWTTNESGGSETVVDAATAAVRGTVPLGGEAGNVAYDPTSRQMLADVQTRDQLAVIDPATLHIRRRVALPGCDHDHGLTLAPADRLAFVACDGNARLLTVDLTTWHVTGTDRVGEEPDVLAYDPAARHLYVASETGWVTTADNNSGHLNVTGRAHLADGAHVVAVDSTTHLSYYPVPHGSGGHPALLVYRPGP